jgi:outer membrane protein OmpA-like peptidoglycan-associated protein
MRHTDRPTPTRRWIRLAAGLVGVGLAAASLVPAQADPAQTFPQSVYDQLAADQERINSTTITDAMRQDAVLHFDADDATVRFDAEDATVPPATTTAEAGTQTIQLRADVLFDFASATLTPTAAAKIPDFLTDIPAGAAIEVNGHTDSVGADADNQTLSEQRAQAVATVVTSARPDLAVTTHGYGETQPVAPNTNDDGSDNPIGRSQNRRVEIIYQG